MNGYSEENQLLRKSVVDNFKILDCSIIIELNQNLKTADYTYNYEIQKQRESKDVWREVFAYPKDEFTVLNVKNRKDNGLNYVLSSLDTPARNACLEINFNKDIDVGEKYSFNYKCNTRIESISNISTFGGNGVAWYWVAHEYPCDLLTIIIKIPKKLIIKDTHPQRSKIEENNVFFENRSLVSNEFAPVLVTYEKNALGLSPKHAKWVGTILTLILGGLISLGLTILFT